MALRLIVGILLLLSGCATQQAKPHSRNSLFTFEEYMVACRLEVLKPSNIKTATYLQRRFNAETEGMSIEEEVDFSKSYCQARFFDLTSDLVKSWMETQRFSPPITTPAPRESLHCMTTNLGGISFTDCY